MVPSEVYAVAAVGTAIRVQVDLTGADSLTPAVFAAVSRAADEMAGTVGAATLVLLAGGADGSPARPLPADVHAVNRWERALRALERTDAVTVTVVRGSCRGPALEAMLCTDHRIAALDAQFWMPRTGATAWPGMLLHRMANQIGVGRARSVALRQAPLDAASALALGLVDEVVESPLDRLAELLPELDEVPGTEWAVRRRLILESSASFDEALGAHLAACDRALRRSSGA